MKYDEGYHGTRLAFDPKRPKVWKPLTGWLQRYVPDDGTVVDVGCGHADFLRFINAKRRIGIDVFKSSGFPPGCEFIKAPVWDTHKHVKGADAVFASNLFEHLTDDELDKALGSIKMALRKGGLLIALQPNFRYSYREYFDDYTHVKVFTDVSLSDRLRAAGFEIAEVRPRFTPYSMKSRMPVASWLVWLYLRSPIRPKAGQMLVVARKR